MYNEQLIQCLIVTGKVETRAQIHTLAQVHMQSSSKTKCEALIRNIFAIDYVYELSENIRLRSVINLQKIASD